MKVLARKTFHWTLHSRAKMRRYGLSEARVRRILHSPGRIEGGVAPGTAAFMQNAGSAKHPHELWVMVEDTKKERRIISAWRYPGKTKPRSAALRSMIRGELAESETADASPSEK